jgi:hypothetical protein
MRSVLERVMRTVPADLEELLAVASHREPLGPTAEGLSSATFERVVLDGVPHVVKRISFETDWVMRATHDLGVPRVVRLWATGTFEALHDAIDTALVRCSFDPETGATALLMRDVGPFLLPDAEPIDVAMHARFLDHMASLHAATWGMADDIGLTPPAIRWTILSPSVTAAEAARGITSGVPAIVAGLWQRLGEVAPDIHAVLAALSADPAPLVRALAATPTCLVHGDWKGGNLGGHPDGRTILLDWAFPGIDAPCADLAWYLGVNCDRLPETKEASIERYRDALEGHGIDTEPWWDAQLPLALLGCAVQQGWSKAEQPDELAWWSAAVRRAVPLLDGR